MKKTILIILCLIFANNTLCQTQKASLVFLDGDILEGYGIITKKNEIKFRISLDDAPDIWDSLLIKGIIFHGFEIDIEYEYIHTKRNKEPELLRIVSKGKITVYERKKLYTNYTNYLHDKKGNNGSFYVGENVDLFIKRDGEEVATLYNRTMKKSIQNYFKDCDVMVDLIESKEYTKYSRIELVKNYNIFCGD
ncbi:hypothetical protein P8625_01625 [Tenacibaculum tangerinum]|uniref:DUF4369 domain-containing protein n=1 Tax=Tenacibaculum tangerinum TaxID=3038772 RepID=A0ABY8L7G7_9FLAO|nr:hypothetical protein [Tenacibaculum tangerinum]WGH75890.1 hypothetical protein P8625_01625 [Tenacibaculum tangerinum]